MRKRQLAGTLAIMLILGGCALTRSPYRTPALDLPGHWQHDPASAPAPLAADQAWWHAFGDPQLDALVALAQARNNDLVAAGLKLKQALLKADLARSDMLPSVSVTQTGSASRNLGRSDSVAHSFTATGSVSYEVDLWDKLAAARDVKTWEARATAADLADTRLSLIASVVKYYWQLGYLNQRIELARASTAYSARTLALVDSQYRAGAASKLDLLSARQSLASQEASETDLIEQREETRAALAILFDGPPDRRFAELPRLPETPLPAIRAGLPAEVLARRPDVRAAELRLRKDLAAVDQTRAGYYPALTLTGSVATGGSQLGNVLTNPVGTLASSLTLPFLNWNERRLNISVSEAEYQQAVAEFRQTLYSALGDVEKALSAHTQYGIKGERLAQSLDAARRMERLYEVRYRAGASSLKDWLDAQQTRRTAEVSYVENRYNQLVNQVTVYQALGGS